MDKPKRPTTDWRMMFLDNGRKLGRDSRLMRLSVRPAFRNLGRGVF
jgi:hypothetical protein